jgi:hypothetical protein
MRGDILEEEVSQSKPQENNLKHTHIRKQAHIRTHTHTHTLLAETKVKMQTKQKKCTKRTQTKTNVLSTINRLANSTKRFKNLRNRHLSNRRMAWNVKASIFVLAIKAPCCGNPIIYDFIENLKSTKLPTKNVSVHQ